LKRKEFNEQMRQRLIERRAALMQNVTGDASLLDGLKVSAESGDSADQATNSLHGEISAQLADVEFREIANIDKALRQVADGAYGICEGCRKNIPMKRLDAIPHASFCIDCKRLAEEHDVEGEPIDWAAIHGFEVPTTDSDVSVS